MIKSEKINSHKVLLMRADNLSNAGDNRVHRWCFEKGDAVCNRLISFVHRLQNIEHDIKRDRLSRFEILQQAAAEKKWLSVAKRKQVNVQSQQGRGEGEGREAGGGGGGGAHSCESGPYAVRPRPFRGLRRRQMRWCRAQMSDYAHAGYRRLSAVERWRYPFFPHTF